MSEDKKTYRIISEQELKNYLEGRLSPGQQHDLERKALNSAIEGDALEGWESHDVEYLMYDMTLLRERLAKKSSRKAGIWMAVAAAVLLIVGVGSVFKFWLSEEGDKQPIALQEEVPQPQEESVAVVKTAPQVEEESEKVVELAKQEKAIIQQSQSKAKVEKPEEKFIALNSTPPKKIVAINDEVMSEESFEMEDLAMVEMEIPTEEISSKKQDKMNVRNKMKVTGAVSRSVSASMPSDGTYTVFGLVTDENEESLPGVSIVVKGSDLGTVTNIDGYFSIDLQGEKNTLQFQFIGYVTTERVVTNEVALKVQLSQDMLALEEVVIVGYGTQSSSAITGSASTVETDDFENSYEKARPSDGWDALAQYIEKNKEMPKEALQKGISGRVKLKLTISARGEITNIEVKKGLGYGCDDEAIRLIKSTGIWIPARQNDEAVESTQNYRINFP